MAKKKKNYRAVVIGCGKIGALLEADPKRPKPATHAAVFAAHKRIRLAGLVDIDKENLRQASYLFPGVSAYTNAGQCLKEVRPDIVAIATTPEVHRALIALSLKYRVAAIICEKPLAHSLADAKKIMDLLRGKKTFFFVNHQRRFFPLFAQSRAFIRKGGLGVLRQINAYYGNGFLNNGSHTVDALRQILNDEVVWVFAIENKRNSFHPSGDPNIDGVIFFKRGIVATIQSVNQESYGMHEFRFFGDRGALFIEQYGYEVKYVPVQPSRYFKFHRELAVDKARRVRDVRSMINGVADHAVACLDGKAKPISSAKDGLEVMKVLAAIQQSAQRDGKKIYVR